MNMNLENLDTERMNKHTKIIDTMDTGDILKTINAEDSTVPNIVLGIVDQIEVAVNETYKRMKQGGRLVYIGAGTSGRLGILDASECPPTYGIDATLVQGIMAGGDNAIRTAIEGAEDDENLAIEDLKKLNITTLDTVCGLAASGRTPYVKAALRYTKELGALTLSICCVQNSELSKIADVAMEAVVGPEVISGSTRMKAGTAQKLILNMISTTLMIKLGKVYGNLMVDVKATNKKLVERAKRIIMLASGSSYDEACKLFKASNQNVKVAIIMKRCNVSVEESIRLLHKYDENITKVIGQEEEYMPI